MRGLTHGRLGILIAISITLLAVWFSLAETDPDPAPAPAGSSGSDPHDPSAVPPTLEAPPPVTPAAQTGHTVPGPNSPLRPAPDEHAAAIPIFGGQQPVLGRMFTDQPGLARAEIDEATGRRRPVAPGRAPPVSVSKFVDLGLVEVEGTVELTSERTPDLEEGTPVALSGRVTVEGSGEPVEGAEVVLRSAFYTRALFYDHHLREVARAVTDVDGKFAIERLNVDPVHFGEGGKVYLSVSHDDHAPLLAIPLVNVAPGYRNELLNLVLPAESFTVTGVVLDMWEGKPVAGGRVVATGQIDPIQYPKDQREALFLSAPETVTDGEGKFTLTHVGRGAQWITIHGGNDCAGRQMVTVPVEGKLTIRSRQLRGRIAGRVLDEYDRPISLVRIDGGENTTHSFADGSFVLENFRGDSIAVVFSHVDYRPHTVKGVVDGERELIVRMTSKWRNVHFRVVGHANDKPIRKVVVRLEFAEGKAAPLPSSPFYLSKKGVHAVRVPDGVTKAVITAKDREPVEMELGGARDGDEIEVVLRKTD